MDKIATKKSVKDLAEALNKRLELVDEKLANVSIPIDGNLSTSSPNPVENRVITEALNELDESITSVDDINPLLNPDALVLHFITNSSVTISKYSYYEYKIRNLSGDSAWQSCTNTINVLEGDYLYLRIRSNSTNSTIGTIQATGQFNLGGNIEALRSSSYKGQAVYQCFKSAFANNTGLLSAKYLKLPQLTSITLGSSSESHHSMFLGCTSLVEAPELPSSSLDIRGYQYMFKGCTSLRKAPELPATVLNNYSYLGMFEGCISLVEAPSVLPVTDISNYYYCYESMFSGCKSLIKGPKIMATVANSRLQFRYMFQGCSSLRYIECLLTTLYPSAMVNWVDGVPSEGVFVTASNVTWTNGTNGIPVGWTVLARTSSTPEESNLGVVNKRIDAFKDSMVYMNMGDVTNLLESLGFPPNYTWKYFTIEALANTTITWSRSDQKYSLDNGATWNTWNGSVSMNQGDKLMLAAISNIASSFNNTGKPIGSTEGNIKVSGNVMSLAYGDDFFNATDQLDGYITGLFSNNTHLVDASNLRIGNGVYSGNYGQTMFYGCINLINGPSILDATILSSSCYRQMFYGCTNLIKAPKLLATTLSAGCYQYMFQECASLTQAPELLASTVASTAYQGMFKNCTSLVSITSVTVGNVKASGCKEMFYGCTSLTSVLPIALTGVTNEDSCFEGMYRGCTDLVDARGIVLSSTGYARSSMYKEMFYGCTSLVYGPSVPSANTFNPGNSSNAFTSMFEGCTALTTVLAGTYRSSDYDFDRVNFDRMYYGCTSLVDASTITINDTSNAAEWTSMFEGCTSLTTSPIIDFQHQGSTGWWNFNKGVCSRMFYGCSSLNSITCLLPTYPSGSISDMSAGNFTDWVHGVASSGIFTKCADSNFWSTGDSGIPTGWTTQVQS